MPRFVILEHDHPVLHWDFMLEAGEILLTWRLSTPPTPKAIIDAERIGDHRRFYLDHEGPVSGGRGRVVRWDSGEFEWLTNEGDRQVVRLKGSRLDGTFHLAQTSETTWQGIYEEGT